MSGESFVSDRRLVSCSSGKWDWFPSIFPWSVFDFEILLPEVLHPSGLAFPEFLDRHKIDQALVVSENLYWAGASSCESLLLLKCLNCGQWFFIVYIVVAFGS